MTQMAQIPFTINKEICRFLASYKYHIEPDKLNPSFDLTRTLDSLDIFELVTELEDKTGFIIPDRLLPELCTPQAFYDAFKIHK